MVRIVVNDILDAIKELEEKLGGLESNYKILLTYDGTLEYILRVLSKRDVKFMIVKQIEHDDRIEREAILEGDYKVYAKSIIYKEGLPLSILNAIREKRLSLGRILKENRLETFRSIIEVGYKDRLYRIYDIFHKGRIIIKIREEFY